LIRGNGGKERSDLTVRGCYARSIGGRSIQVGGYLSIKLRKGKRSMCRNRSRGENLVQIAVIEKEKGKRKLR